MIGDTGKHVAQVGQAVEAVELGALDQGVEGRRALGAAVGSGEEVVLTPDRSARSTGLLSSAMRPSSNTPVSAVHCSTSGPSEKGTISRR